MFDILLLDVWISDDTLPLGIDIFVSVFRHLRTHHCCSSLINYFSVFGYQIKHSSCLIYYFSVFGYQIKHSLCLIHYFSTSGYQIKHSSRLIYYFSTFGYQMKHSSRLIYCFSLFGYLMKHFSRLIHYFSVLGYQTKHSSCFSDISLLVFDILGSLNNNDGDGYEKVKSRCFKLYCAYSISFNSSNVGHFVWS